MQKKRLIVFAGKPGAGKSTLIKRLAKDHVILDVWPFISVYVEPGQQVPPEEKNILGYQALYAHLATVDAPKTILELGTNYPDFNVAELAKLHDRYEIDILLCDASIETCRQRGYERHLRYGASFELRLQRDFPNTFIQELKRTPLRYTVMSTEGSLEEVHRRFQERLKDKL